MVEASEGQLIMAHRDRENSCYSQRGICCWKGSSLQGHQRKWRVVCVCVFNLVLDFHYFKKVNFLVCVSIKIPFELQSILVLLLIFYFFFGGGGRIVDMDTSQSCILKSHFKIFFKKRERERLLLHTRLVLSD